MEKALFGAGCFWGVEAAFRKVKGVRKTSVGYAGGKIKNPSYEQVCTGRTKHIEVVEVVFDPQKVSYKELLRVFWNCHNPTQLNRQGPDVGIQYKSVIFYHNEMQKEEAIHSKKEKQKEYTEPIVTEILSSPEFYPAEEYHQQYLEKRGLAVCHF